MDSEIDLRSMYDSMEQAIDGSKRFNHKSGISDSSTPPSRSCDHWTRLSACRCNHPQAWSNHLDPSLRTDVDNEKQQIVRLLLEVRRAAAYRSSYLWRSALIISGGRRLPMSHLCRASDAC
jgi:hypothetical protein